MVSPFWIVMVAAVPPVSITATSLAPGTTPPLQFEPTSKRPLPGLIQLIVARRVRSSSDSTLGRYSRFFGRPLLSVVGFVVRIDERRLVNQMFGDIPPTSKV